MISEPRLKKHNMSVYFNISDKSGNEGIYYNIDTLNTAIEEKKQVKIKYYSRKFDENRNVYKRIKEMTINPYALAWQDDHYYLLGNHKKYENLIHLRVDRITSVEITSEKSRHFSEVCEYTERFDTADYLDKLFGMHGGEFEEIKFCCNKKITEPVLDRFSEDIFINNVTDDEFCFSVKAAVSQALVTWVMNYGSDLKVLKPESLKNMIRNRAEEILKNY
jgi:predicted DNA-binding transcriptional regulator YafY